MVNIACDSRLSLHCWLLYEQIAIYIQDSRFKVKDEIKKGSFIAPRNERV